ncbi:CPBP family glutamic-type intramembrane protease [Novosphingobium sp. KCTC 2891]|uniref:CPBP family glutamic-type intramembrane protease n=1 Tax=Novosphingobium sp. KCTC 2891 TaxID=2989730 RepID=UPI002221528A|nr:CPBP family glutamic-type intramembrane protease [Novosphingobium sp. KCTC 2891]MCW1381986.1 CPBP family glutamic-type intramembrane protease [Novosphingobium sp. KCTC 2891]
MPDAKPSALSAFSAFLRRPTLIEPAGLGSPEARRLWAGMAALHLGVLLLVLLPFLRFWQQAFGLPAPDAYGKLPAMVIVPVVVLAAPVLEEAVFRGWLTGRPRALWLLCCGAAVVVLGLAASRGLDQVLTSVLFLTLLVAAPLGWFVLRRRSVPGVFRSAFPLAFFGSALVFALSHLANYPRISLAAVPLVLPQLWTGLTAGFVRMRIGLPGSILLHGLSNAAALGLAVLVSLL